VRTKVAVVQSVQIGKKRRRSKPEVIFSPAAALSAWHNRQHFRRPPFVQIQPSAKLVQRSKKFGFHENLTIKMRA
jgi:hypothetical protein